MRECILSYQVNFKQSVNRLKENLNEIVFYFNEIDYFC